MKLFRRLYYRLFARYRRLELQGMDYAEADALIRANAGKAEGAQWQIAKEEDNNRVPNLVWLERRVRIRE